MKLPYFLIIGGMRCGSTTLHELLRRQPAICLPGIKEVHFFDRRNPEIGDSVAGYQQLFSHCSENELTGKAMPGVITRRNCSARKVITWRSTSRTITCASSNGSDGHYLGTESLHGLN